VAMTRARDELDIIVPQRFYVGHPNGAGARHVYGAAPVSYRRRSSGTSSNRPGQRRRRTGRGQNRPVAAVNLAAQMACNVALKTKRHAPNVAIFQPRDGQCATAA